MPRNTSGASKKRKAYYRSNHPHKQARGSKGILLAPGMKGFICTCNKRVKECIREAQNILNDYAAKLYDVNENDDIENDVENELARELEELKNKDKERRFQVVDTGIKSCVFIKTNVESPTLLADTIMKDIYQSKQCKSRFLLRLVPISVTCKAYIEDISKIADKMFDEYFKGEATTFSIFYSKRHNNNIVRDELIANLAQLVEKKNPNHKVDLTHSRKTVVVEIIKSVCGISVVEDFYKYRRYNLIELGRSDKEDSKNTKAKDGVKDTKDEEKKEENTNNRDTDKDEKDTKDEDENTNNGDTEDRDASFKDEKDQVETETVPD